MGQLSSGSVHPGTMMKIVLTSALFLLLCTLALASEKDERSVDDKQSSSSISNSISNPVNNVLTFNSRQSRETKQRWEKKARKSSKGKRAKKSSKGRRAKKSTRNNKGKKSTRKNKRKKSLKGKKG